MATPLPTIGNRILRALSSLTDPQAVNQYLVSLVTTTEARLTAVENAAGVDFPGVVPVDLKASILAAGTPLAKYAGAGPGLTLSNSKAMGVKWTAGTLTTIWTEVDLPIDLDPTFPVTVSMQVSKDGATATDVVSMTVAAYAQTVGTLEDAGANLGGVSPALTTAQASAAAKTITELQVPIYLPPTAPARLSLSFTPSGTLATDNLLLEGVWLEYRRRPATPRALIDLRGAILAAGTPLAAFADNAASAPGITLDNSKAVGPRWNDAATQVAIWSSLVVPPDLDVTKPCTVVVLCDKSGSTVGDATTFDVGIFAQVPGALEDATSGGLGLGGTTTAIVGNATAKTVQKVILGIAPNKLPSAPANLSISIKPTNGTLGTDDIIVVGFWLEYQRASSGSPVVMVDLKDAILATGDPMAAFANNAGASAPGVTLDNSKATAVRWNNFATQTAIFADVDLPLDLDVNQAVTINVLASKSGATAADATTFDIGVFQQTPGAAEDATAGSLGIGGTTTALPGAATAKTVSLVSYTIPAPTQGAASLLQAAPGHLTLSIKPTNGTNLTDDVVVNGMWLSYSKKSG